ncbi:MAG: hypothetical protein RSB09_00625 [Clostridia bacterium]
MKEIGGYFELENFAGAEYHRDCYRLNTARNALLFLCRSKAIKKVYLPYFLCESVYQCLAKNNILVEFYHINERFEPLIDNEIKSGEFLYFVNSYGQFNNARLSEYVNRYHNIIIDNVHAFFQSNLTGVDTIYSCRKFFGVPDGAYLYSDCKGFELEQDISMARMKHILGRYERSAKEYFKDFQASDNEFEDMPILKMSKLTNNLLKAIDYDKIINVRKRNYAILANSLSQKNVLELGDQDVPFCYPLYVENGNIVRKELIENNIFVPTLWTNVSKEYGANDLEIQLAANILPIPCDQRYDSDDMNLLTKKIKEIL